MTPQGGHDKNALTAFLHGYVDRRPDGKAVLCAYAHISRASGGLGSLYHKSQVSGNFAAGRSLCPSESGIPLTRPTPRAIIKNYSGLPFAMDLGRHRTANRFYTKEPLS